jgi:two-component system, NtrC family, sensor kinase
VNIRQKCLLAIAASLVASATLNMAVLRMWVFPAFIELEHQAAVSDLNRAIAAIDRQITEVGKMSVDYATWDETYLFALGQNDDYVRSHLYASGIENIEINLISVYDRAGWLLYEAIYEVGTGEAAPAGALALARIDPDRALLADSDDGGRSGVVMTGRGPLVIASRPIFQSSGESSYAGTFVTGRLLDENLVAELNTMTGVRFELLPAAAGDLDAEARAAVEELSGGEEAVIEEIGRDLLAAYGLIRDLEGAPAVVIRASVERDISRAGEKALLWGGGGLVLAGVVVMAVMLALLQAVLVGPVRHLTRHLLAIGNSGDLAQRLASRREDEIGTLSREFDNMLEKLAEARNRLLDQSYSAGIAEMASGVLHNIRNQLAPLSLRLERLQGSLDQAKETKIARAVAELKSPETVPERKQKLLQFLELSCQRASDRQAAAVAELKSVAEDFGRVEHILRDLDHLSRKSMAGGSVSLSDVVYKTVAMLPKYPDIEVVICIDAKMDNCPQVACEPFVLKHVLQNLFVNAIESMFVSGKARGTIHVNAAAGDHHARPCIDLQIRDEGMGIPPDKLETIFSRGYSTKTGKVRRGTGLHWCANSMLAIGGRIFAESPGPQQGATLHLLVPIAAPETKAVA